MPLLSSPRKNFEFLARSPWACRREQRMGQIGTKLCYLVAEWCAVEIPARFISWIYGETAVDAARLSWQPDQLCPVKERPTFPPSFTLSIVVYNYRSNIFQNRNRLHFVILFIDNYREFSKVSISFASCKVERNFGCWTIIENFLRYIFFAVIRGSHWGWRGKGRNEKLIQEELKIKSVQAIKLYCCYYYCFER